MVVNKFKHVQSISELHLLSQLQISVSVTLIAFRRVPLSKLTICEIFTCISTLLTSVDQTASLNDLRMNLCFQCKIADVIIHS
jgi:hypothetical protein